MPWDFLLDKTNFKPSELEQRLEAEGRKIFFKDVNQDEGIPSLGEGVWPLEDLKERLKSLRAYLIDLAIQTEGNIPHQSSTLQA